MITVLTVNYNTPEYLERMLSSFRKFYDLPCIVVDGSSKENYKPIKYFDKKFNITIYHFDYNIHHGPGMEFGIKQIDTDRILLCDSDIIFHGKGIIELMDKQLKDHEYGIGDIQQEKYKVNNEFNYVSYLHPAFALINRKIANKYIMPQLNGAPLLAAMLELEFLQLDLIKSSKEVTQDFWKHTKKYIQHNHNNKGMGTVKKTGGYNY